MYQLIISNFIRIHINFTLLLYLILAYYYINIINVKLEISIQPLSWKNAQTVKSKLQMERFRKKNKYQQPESTQVSSSCY